MPRIADWTTGTYTGITPVCVRSTTGYAVNVAGDTVTSFAANTICRSDKGAIIRPAETNSVLQSQDATVSPWATFNNFSGTVAVTQNSGVAPDGTTTAAKVDINRTVAGFDFAIVSQDISSSGTNVFEAFFKAVNVGDVGKQFGMNLHSGVPKTVTTVTLTADWKKFTSATQASPTQLFFGYSDTGNWPGDGGATGPVSFYVSFADVALSPGLSAPIVTTSAAVTTAADDISFTVRAGATALTHTLSDNSTVNVTGLTPGATYTMPNYSPLYVKYTDDNASAGATANLSVTLGGLTVSHTALALAQASVTRTLGNLVILSQTQSLARANFARQLNALAIAAQARSLARANLDRTLGSLDRAITAQAFATGTLSRTLGSLSAVASAAVLVSASVNVVLGPVSGTASATGGQLASASLNRTLGAVGAVSLATAPATGSVGVTLGTLSPVATATILARGSAAVTLGPVGVATSGSVVARAGLVLTLRPIAFVGTATVSAGTVTLPTPPERRIILSAQPRRIVLAAQPRRIVLPRQSRRIVLRAA